MNLDELQHLLHTNATTVTEEYTRLFHGRGNTYDGYRFLTVDSVDKVLFAVLFDTNDEEEAIISMLRNFFCAEGKWEALVVQQRYLPTSPTTVIEGELPPKTYAIENGLKYHINFLNPEFTLKFIGHSDINTTMRYIKPTDEDLRECMVR